MSISCLPNKLIGKVQTTVSDLGKMAFELVKYSSEFQVAVVDLWRKCNLIVPQNDPVDDIHKKIEFQPDLFFIGLLGGQVVGSIMVGYEGHRGWINYLAVAPEYQKRGYGTKLVLKAIGELKKLGCLKINLQVRRSNTSVVEFYNHLGFKEDDVLSLGMRLK
jgi:ribosomal protein S18 acetylase RimI-like enzyme